MLSEATVKLPPRVAEEAGIGLYRIRNHTRRDGLVSYELLDELTNKVCARSRNFKRIQAWRKLLMRGTKGG